MLPIRTIYFFGASGKLDGNGGTDAAGLAASQRFFEKTKIPQMERSHFIRMAADLVLKSHVPVKYVSVQCCRTFTRLW